MALALPDNGEVNNREVVGRRLTSDSGGARNFEEEDEDEYEHHGELQNGEYDEEDTEPGELASCLRRFEHDCGIWKKLNVTSCNLSSSQPSIQALLHLHHTDHSIKLSSVYVR
jgi:hypothetical protein